MFRAVPCRSVPKMIRADYFRAVPCQGTYMPIMWEYAINAWQGFIGNLANARKEVEFIILRIGDAINASRV